MVTLHMSEQEARVLGLENKLGHPLAVKKVRKKRGKSEGEELLALQIKVSGLPDPVRERRFHPTRRWRFDFCFPGKCLAIEVDGSVYKNGRHNRGKGFEGDCEKLAEAAILGWTVLRFSTGQVKSGMAIDVIKRLLVGMEEKAI